MNSPTWLKGIRAAIVAPEIWEIRIAGYGPADVGPYSVATRYAATLRGSRPSGQRTSRPYVDNVPLEAHHIVGREHLSHTRQLYDDASAPAVIITADMHRRLISPRITAEQNYLGGRPRDGRALITAKEALALYEEVYTRHTPFVELFYIARNVFT